MKNDIGEYLADVAGREDPRCERCDRVLAGHLKGDPLVCRDGEGCNANDEAENEAR